MGRRVLWMWCLAVVLSVSVVQATNRYIRAGASGANNGTDWTNAYTGWPATFTRGDTYYVAGGTYPAQDFTTNASGTTLITIQKATVADHGTATGWNDTYGTTQAVLGGLFFSTSYWTLDGVTGGGPVEGWTSNFGFKVQESGDTLAVIRLITAGVTNITLRHLEFQGKGSVATGGGGQSNDCLDVRSVSNVLVSYYWMHGCGRCPFFIGPLSLTAEYGLVGQFFGDEAVHSELASIWAIGTQNLGNVTFRYNVFEYVTSTGGIMWDNSTDHTARLDIYGNVFYSPSSLPYQNSANGVIGGWTGSNGEDFFNVHVYNNTFINIPGPGDMLGGFPLRVGNTEARNNLFYTVTNPGGGAFITITHNHFVSTSTIGTNTSTSTGNPFVDYTNRNFALTANTPAGTTLSAPYNVDMLGHIRTTWTRGALEFASVSMVEAPTNLRYLHK